MGPFALSLGPNRVVFWVSETMGEAANYGRHGGRPSEEKWELLNIGSERTLEGHHSKHALPLDIWPPLFIRSP